MEIVRDLLAVKGRHLTTISPRASVHTAVLMMNDQKIGSVLVMHEGRMIGILTERDILMHVVGNLRDPRTMRVEDAMTYEVICCQPDTTLEEARSVMKNRRVRHLPVLADNGDVVGLVSIGDLNAYKVTDQERTIYFLHEYIQGRA